MPNWNVVNKRGLITWGGEDSDNYGIYVSESPVFDKPKRKQTVFNIPGRNGSILFQESAFEDVARSYNVWVAEQTGDFPKTLPEIVSDLTSWLNSGTGYQRLEDSFEPDVFRLAYYSGGDNFSDNMLQYGESELIFTCRPERFLKSGETPVALVNGGTIENPTRFDSKPLIHIEGSGTVSVTINNSTITAQIVDYINIDCERMNAYRLPSENMNDKIIGSFPVLAGGYNSIATTGTITTATITPRFYTI